MSVTGPRRKTQLSCKRATAKDTGTHLGLIDYGAVGRLSLAERRNFAALLIAICEFDDYVTQFFQIHRAILSVLFVLNRSPVLN